MLLSESLENLIIFFRTSQNSFYHIAESRELNCKIKGPKHIYLAMWVVHVLEFCDRLRHDVNTRTMLRPKTPWNFTSRVCETRKFVMAILHWKQGLLYDNW